MRDLEIRPMARTEYDRWRAAAIESYAREQVAAGLWPASTAAARATASNDDLLPTGFETPDMLFLTAVRPGPAPTERPGTGLGGVPVGLVWLGLVHPLGVPDCGFLYEIEVFAPYRRQGYGRALLSAAERVVRDRGLTGLELNVLGTNRAAIRLYEKAGYGVTTQRMRKPLPPTARQRIGAR